MKTRKQKTDHKHDRKNAINKAKSGSRSIFRRHTIVIVIAVFLAACAICVMAIPLLAKPVIAFYGLPQAVSSAIKAQASDPKHPGKYPYRFKELDASKPLALQLREKGNSNISLVFTRDGEAARSIAGKSVAPDATIRKTMPSTMRKAGIMAGTNGTDIVYGLPILLDHFELAFSKGLFPKEGPQTLAELEAGAKAAKKPTVWPIVCPGAEDEDLLMLAGAMTEALGGEAAWDEVTKEMKAGTAFAEIASDSPLGATIRQLITWRKQGLLHPEWFRMKPADISAFMENGFAAIVFMPLSTHRTIPLKTIEKFGSATFPAVKKNVTRSFTVQTYIGILIGPKKANPKTRMFLESLAEPAAQKNCRPTLGLPRSDQRPRPRTNKPPMSDSGLPRQTAR